MLEELRVMDQTAVTLSRENALPLIVLNAHRPGSVLRAVRGRAEGTLVSEAPTTAAGDAPAESQQPV